MFALTYHNYFAKDKPFRHVIQHLGIAFIGFFLLHFLVKIPLEISNILIFFVVTYLVDLDGILAVFIWRNKIPELKKCTNLILQAKFKDALQLGTLHHKKLNRLILHNIVNLCILITLFIYALTSANLLGMLIGGAMLTHFTFDILDDIYQLGHIRNWLWPLTILRSGINN